MRPGLAILLLLALGTSCRRAHPRGRLCAASAGHGVLRTSDRVPRAATLIVCPFAIVGSRSSSPLLGFSASGCRGLRQSDRRCRRRSRRSRRPEADAGSSSAARIHKPAPTSRLPGKTPSPRLNLFMYLLIIFKWAWVAWTTKPVGAAQPSTGVAPPSGRGPPCRPLRQSLRPSVLGLVVGVFSTHSTTGHASKRRLDLFCSGR